MTSLVIIPTFNEKENIENIIRAVFGLDEVFHILIVDDGSPDGTAAIVKELQHEFTGKLHVLEREGKHVSPEDWNEFIKNEDVALIDIRKPFEHHIGSFQGAINPNINSFREFKGYFDNLIKENNKKLAIFCTGGIRCEKASEYLKEKGFEEVYQLKGGILNYINSVEEKNSLWNGECFVFDKRVSVKHKSIQGSYTICYACRMYACITYIVGVRPEDTIDFHVRFAWAGIARQYGQLAAARGTTMAMGQTLLNIEKNGTPASPATARARRTRWRSSAPPPRGPGAGAGTAAEPTSRRRGTEAAAPDERRKLLARALRGALHLSAKKRTETARRPPQGS